MIPMLACSTTTPVYVPLVLTAWGLLCWFGGFRKFVRDPRAAIQDIAETRAKSRLLHPFGGGDVVQEFRRQWRLRWVGWIAILGYAVGVLVTWLHMIGCWLSSA
jgi:hypothetical protein